MKLRTKKERQKFKSVPEKGRESESQENRAHKITAGNNES